ncbi:MAG: hypothetical protein KatS3mg007_1044 [Thermoanaerobaculum sp.]|nr:MAG: hypothetical protein KatS3mg007_1044 [Thermoanaerobaculum sp.]
MHFVYVLRSDDGELYVGRTAQLEKRLESHNKGQNRSTRGRQWTLVYYEAYLASEDAARREKQLKRHGQALRWLKHRIASSLREGG